MAEPEKTKPRLRSEADLNQERENIAEQLMASRFGDAEHDHLEARFNNIERELFIRRGGDPNDYKYKYDVRHYFAFYQKLEKGRIVERRAEMAQLSHGKGKYALKPTDEVIDWRKTEVGRKADAAVRRTIAESLLDDAGHLIGLQFGTDPRERLNLVPQNYLQNQGGGTWHRSENSLKENLQRYNSCHVAVTVTFKEEKFGQRVSSWKMDAWGINRNGGTVRFDENVIHLNTAAHYSSRTEGFRHMAAVREGSQSCGNAPITPRAVK